MNPPDAIHTAPAPLGQVSRADVVQAARAWLGTPYAHQARLRGVGVDCAGLVIGVARELGLVKPDFDVGGYARRPDGVSLLMHCNRWMKLLARPELCEPGDVIAIRFEEDPQHLGIVADYLHGGRSVIHALDQRGHVRGQVVEHRLDVWLRPGGPAVAAFRLPGVA